MTQVLLNDSAGSAKTRAFMPADGIRAQFSAAMSAMYRDEVPQYGTLLDLVAEVNAAALRNQPGFAADANASARLQVEMHGAIRVGTESELHNLRRMFAVMGMFPVGYYDLSVAGVPVHATAFRPVTSASLAANPFRVFTSLLRLDLIQDKALRELADGILRSRQIFSERALTLTAQFESAGGLDDNAAGEFVREVLHTFRWHGEAKVTREVYERLHDAHRLVADVVCFKGPHINHLTPRTLDIDAAQAKMAAYGITAKEVIEGPPCRKVPLLLRQTSFKALEEPVRFAGSNADGAHTARFGEIEQRGIALTRKGRALYDSLLQGVREKDGPQGNADRYQAELAKAFQAFPDDLATLRREGLGFFSYAPCTDSGGQLQPGVSLEALLEQGLVKATPITYEDFLPVSAAGIFQSNLGSSGTQACAGAAAQPAFEQALGVPVLDEMTLYEAEQAQSIKSTMQALDLETPHVR